MPLLVNHHAKQLRDVELLLSYTLSQTTIVILVTVVLVTILLVTIPLVTIPLVTRRSEINSKYR